MGTSRAGATGGPASSPRLVDLFGDASDGSLAALEPAVRCRDVGPGDVLVRQGERTDLLFVVEGVIAARRTNDDGRGLTLFLLTTNQVSGLGSLARHRSSPVDLVALTAGRIETIPASALLAQAAHDARLGLRLFELAMDYAVRLEHRVDEATFEGARRRLAATILQYEGLIAGGRPVVTRAELAGLIGSSREMLGCALRALEAEGTVARAGHRIEITDRPALQHEGERATAEGGTEGERMDDRTPTRGPGDPGTGAERDVSVTRLPGRGRAVSVES